MAQVLRFGYSVAGVHNLRPSSRAWTPAQLVEHTLTLTPYVLDPRLMGREELYAQGSGDAIGFEPSAKLYAEREKSLKAAKTNLDSPPEKPCRVENRKRQTRDTSESSGASYSTEGRNRQPSGQNLKPNEAEGGNLSYVLPNHS